MERALPHTVWWSMLNSGYTLSIYKCKRKCKCGNGRVVLSGEIFWAHGRARGRARGARARGARREVAKNRMLNARVRHM